MQRKEQKTAVPIKPEGTYTKYGTFLVTIPVCKYEEAQANATAVWWLKLLKEEAPKIVTLLSHKKTPFPKLTPDQEEFFVSALTESIWVECQKPAHQIANMYFRIEYNGENWDLVKKIMQKIDLRIKNDVMIASGIMTVMGQDGKVTFRNGSKIGEVYNPDGKSLRLIDTESYYFSLGFT